nr:zinc finger, CCHC-type [Tanacetum cinerariifolium]
MIREDALYSFYHECSVCPYYTNLEDGKNATIEHIRKRSKWDNDDYVYRGIILNGMSNSFFDIYQNFESVKELWDSLEANYMADDALKRKNYIMYNENKSKHKYHDTKAGLNKKSKETCWKCGKPGHLKKDFKWGKVNNKASGYGSVNGSSNLLKGQNMFNKSLQGEKGIECIVVVYAKHFKAFRFYVIEPNESVSINSITKSWDAIFHENRLSSVPRPSQISLINRTKDIGSSVVPEKVTEEMGVKTTFLNGKEDKEVYMNQPQDFIMPRNESKVDLTKEFLSSRFSMKEMEEADVIFGIRIKYEMTTHMDTSERLMPNNGKAIFLA